MIDVSIHTELQEMMVMFTHKGDCRSALDGAGGA